MLVSNIEDDVGSWMMLDLEFEDQVQELGNIENRTHFVDSF